MESRVIVTGLGFPSLEAGVGFELPLIEEELVAGDCVEDEDFPASGVCAAEEIEVSSATGPNGVKMSLSDVHPQNKHTTPTHPKNVVIFFMPVNIVYISGLNEKKEIYYVLSHYVER
jgi:hypothetical protein